MSVKERPILFNGEMVRALLKPCKTETRRVIKPQPRYIQTLRDGRHETSPDGGFDQGVNYIKCPYGQVGDELWVRETFRLQDFTGGPDYLHGPGNWKCRVRYKSDDVITNLSFPITDIEANRAGRWLPSIHMPRWASRIQLRITEIRVERVQDITDAGSIAEGIPNRNTFGPYSRCPCLSASEHYEFLWNYINEKRGYGWDENPWVWVVVFEVINGL